jgi:hypothetical protein
MMKCRLLSLFLILCALWSGTQGYAEECTHSRSKTDNELIPIGRFQIGSPLFGEHAAFSLLGEAGEKNYRGSGTVGFLFGHSHYFKVSGEYLRQKLGYRFSSGKERRWLYQGAAGAAYEYRFDMHWLSDASLAGFYSHAPNRHLKSVDCPNCIHLKRRIAGSDAGGGSIDLTFIPWGSGTISLAGNYDHVVYHRKHQDPLHISGFGGGVDWTQKLSCNFDFDFRGEFRRPFNYFEGAINWHSARWAGLTLGLFGSHTEGKYRLPNNNTAGVQLGYLIGYRKHHEEPSCRHPGTSLDSALESWVSIPAVYMPEVLAVSDQKKILISGCEAPPPAPSPPTPLPPCLAPTSSTIPDQIPIAVPNTILAGFFFDDPTGTNPLTFTMMTDVTTTGITIDMNTGIITLADVPTPPDTDILITVTGTNACGSTSQSFTIEFEGS